LEEARRSGVGYMLPMMYSWLADLHVKAGEPERGLALVESLLSKTDEASGRAWESELYRQKAEILLALDAPNSAEAEACLGRAVEVARAQAAKSLELRASIVLAQLWQKQDRHADAEKSLKSVRDWFKEGRETADIRRAHADRAPQR
jgi:predicted ATPase